MVGTSSYTDDQILLILEQKRGSTNSNHVIVDLCKINWPNKDWQPKHIAYIFTKYEKEPRFAPRDPSDNTPIEPVVRPKPQRKPRKAPANPKSITRSPAIRKPKTKKEKKAAENALKANISKMSDSGVLEATMAEQTSAMPEVEVRANTTSRLPTIEENFQNLPNGQIGFDNFNQNLEQMDYNELNGYTTRLEHDHEEIMQNHNIQPSYMAADDGQGKAHSEPSDYDYDMPQSPQQNDNAVQGWNQGLVDMLNDVPTHAETFTMPPLPSNHLEPAALDNASSYPNEVSSGQPSQDNGGFDAFCRENYVPAPLPPASNNHGNTQEAAMYQNSDATAENSYPVQSSNETFGQNQNNGEETQNSRSHEAALQARMSAIARNSMNATLTEAQPMNMLTAAWSPLFPGILRGTNEEPSVGTFNRSSAEKRANATISPTPKSSVKRRRESIQNSGRYIQDRTSRTDSQRRANFSGQENRRLDFLNSRNAVNTTGATSTSIAGGNDVPRAPDDDLDGSDESDRSYLQVATTDHIDDIYNASPTHKPKRANRANSNSAANGKPSQPTMSDQNPTGNGKSTMNAVDSSSGQGALLMTQYAQQGNGPSMQQSHRSELMRSNSRTVSGSVGDGQRPANASQFHEPRHNVGMDHCSGMASGNLGRGQHVGNGLPLNQSQQQGNMPHQGRRVTDAPNDFQRVQQPNINSVNQPSMTTNAGEHYQPTGRGELIGHQRMPTGWNHDGLPSAYQQQPMAHHFAPPPSQFGPYVPYGYGHMGYGHPAGVMMPAFGPHYYSSFQPTQMNYGMPTPENEMLNRSSYQHAAQNAPYGIYQAPAPAPQAYGTINAQNQGNAVHTIYGARQALNSSSQYGFQDVPLDNGSSRVLGTAPGNSFAHNLSYNHGLHAAPSNSFAPNTSYNHVSRLPTERNRGLDPAIGTSFAQNPGYNHVGRLQAEHDPRYSIGGSNTAEAAQALLRVQHGDRADANGTRRPSGFSLDTANGGSMHDRPSFMNTTNRGSMIASNNDPTYGGTNSSNTFQPYPPRAPAASTNQTTMVAAPSDGPQNVQGRGFGSAQVAQAAQSSALPAHDSDDDGMFAYDDYPEWHALTPDPAVTSNTPAPGPFVQGDNSDLDSFF